MKISTILSEATFLLEADVKVGDTKRVRFVKDVGVEAWNTGGSGLYVCVGFENKPGAGEVPIWRHESSPWAQKVMKEKS